MIISVSCEAGENFLMDSVKFFDTDECLVYMDNILNEPKTNHNINDFIEREISAVELGERLINKFLNPDDCNKKIIMAIINTLNKKQRKILYYKNNLLQFMKDSPRMQQILSRIILDTKSFINPAKLPKETEPALMLLKQVIIDCVMYNHMVFDPRYRLQTQIRYTARIIDTDSNFFDLSKWVYYCKDLINQKKTMPAFKNNGKYVIPERKIKKNDDNIDENTIFTMVNTITYILSKVVNDTLQMFVKRCNVEDGTPGEISMKNEFYFPKLLNTPAKKHYMGIYSLQEGVYMPTPEIEVKGMEYLKKSNASDYATEFISDLVYNDILLPKGAPDLSNILFKLSSFETSIRKSVEKGEFKFLKVSKVKTDDGYEDPWGIGQWKAVKIWNLLYPDNKIALPGRAYILKVTLTKKAKFGSLSVTNPDIFAKLTHIFDTEERVAKTGITTIGIPLDGKIPDWIKPFIDVDEMVVNNVKLLVPILSALDVPVISKVKNAKYSSNIIQIG